MKLKPQLVDGSYVRIHQSCSRILAENNGGQDIKPLVEVNGSVNKVNLKSFEGLDNKQEIEGVIRYLKEELLIL